MFPPQIVGLTEETVETPYLLGEQDRVLGISGYVAWRSCRCPIRLSPHVELVLIFVGDAEP